MDADGACFYRDGSSSLGYVCTGNYSGNYPGDDRGAPESIGPIGEYGPPIEIVRQKLRDDLRSYFRARNEDSIDEELLRAA